MVGYSFLVVESANPVPVTVLYQIVELATLELLHQIKIQIS